MRIRHFAALVFLSSPLPALAQQGAAPAPPPTPPPLPAGSIWAADPKDVGSLDAIMKAVYDVISGTQGQKRNWERMHSLFVPNARLGPAVQLPDGRVEARQGTLDEWIAGAERGFAQTGFYEKEIARRAEQFGRIAHVFSTYESRRAPGDATPFARGINSFQLLYDGVRWWVVSIYWDSERPGNKIPEKYLQSAP
jgi:hypothetical protein